MSTIYKCLWCRFARADKCRPPSTLCFCDNPENKSGIVTLDDDKTIQKLGCSICRPTDEAIDRSKIFKKGGYKGGILTGDTAALRR